jgi:4-hydroxy-tetrahydrodipicolinate synthase
MTPIFTGVATALVTPFNKNKPDYPSLTNLINRQIEMGVSALVILGTTGEISTLSARERRDIISFAIKTVANRVPLIFGIGGNDPKNIIALGNYVKKTYKNYNGLSSYGVMITTPYYNKATQDGIYEYFRYITDKLRLPTIVYNIPSRTGINAEPETLTRIAKLPYIAGIKEAGGNIAQIQDVVRLCPDTSVYCGDDTLSLPSYAVGCAGIISVAANVAVAPVAEIFAARSLPLYQSQLPFYKSLFRAVNPIPIKYELFKMGLIKNELRLPLLPILYSAK